MGNSFQFPPNLLIVYSYVYIYNHTTATAAGRPIPVDKLPNRPYFNIETLWFAFGSVSVSETGVTDFFSQVPSHLACMYLCFLQGPMCIFLSFIHFLAAVHNIFINDFSLSVFPTYTSGKIPMSRLYSSLPLAISNSALKDSSITTRISPFFDPDFSTISRYSCSPNVFNK